MLTSLNNLMIRMDILQATIVYKKSQKRFTNSYQRSVLSYLDMVAKNLRFYCIKPLLMLQLNLLNKYGKRSNIYRFLMKHHTHMKLSPLVVAYIHAFLQMKRRLSNSFNKQIICFMKRKKQVEIVYVVKMILQQIKMTAHHELPH